MSDQELWAALNVLARRFGLVPDGKRVALVDDEPPVELCRRRSEPDKYGIVLECSKPRGHFENECSWATAFVGIVARGCEAATVYAGKYPIDCRLPAGHEGDHRQDEIHWPVGKALLTPSGHLPCPPSRSGSGSGAPCALNAGHAGECSAVRDDPSAPQT